ncbi:DUF4097 family beta strand repeat-containing protein [Rugosimonospora africana]|uniref:DUF4097 domain-containing protein n=1 Tax=Rugosimonospora africana TaxID=556532 RepID=A0A8J3QM43_9ACTN|nr:DUF4097 family beta strand repeat-containing protein [Rugosimonospora africana]GIH11978.1 hypothetical protein Raf01_01500 [Rugosimonospora africana]
MATWTITEPRRLDITDDVVRLDVSLVAGRLSVVGTDGPARVEISTPGGLRLTVSADGGLLSVRHHVPRTWPGVLQPLWWWINARKFAADVSIAVPYQTAAALKLGSGSVIVSTLHADLNVDCASGRTTLLGVDGRIKATVVSGPIEALGCAGEIALDTVSGEITLADTAARRLSAKTISGALTADLDNPPHDSQITLETMSGEITIRVREDSDLGVELAAVHGRVTSAFPDLQVKGEWGTSVKGTIGAGTGRLRANAIGGNISLLCRPVDEDFGQAGPESEDTGPGPVEASK